jgi:hypothetical protein
MITVPFQSSPYLVDEVVQTLASDLLDLSWIEYAYCVAEMGIDDEGDTYPMIYSQSDWEYYDIRPDDQVKGYCFFTNNGFNVGGNDELIQYNLSLYVWCHLGNITGTQDFTMSLVSDCLAILRDKECFGMFVEMKDPFSEFTALQYHENSMIMRKRSGFRIDFSFWGDNNLC